MRSNGVEPPSIRTRFVPLERPPTKMMTQILDISDSEFQIDVSLPLPAEDVQLWRVDLEAVRDSESRWQRLLSSDESNRASRFHSQRDRQHFVAVRAILRKILSAYLGTDPAGMRFSYSKKEKPSLDAPHKDSGITFNVSHSGGKALLAFARWREIGVDIEQVRRDVDLEAIARRFFSPHEQEQLAAFPPQERADTFFRCWTRKEAYIKATGDGLSLPLSQFDVSLAAGDSSALLATRPDASEAQQWLLREVPGGTGYVAALCARGRDWKLKSWS
jgi:4'-phosphopantetheinyl transferase